MAEQEFRDQLAAVGYLDWRAELTLGPAADFIAREARVADLLVTETRPRESYLSPTGHAEAGDLLMRLGRPLLCVPEGVEQLKFGRALVCWKDSREARRAIADALPLLEKMQRVDVVEIVGPAEGEGARESLGEVADWLLSHRIEANCATEPARGADAAQLAGIARDLDADLIVAGAFGHSRLREWAFGGVTRNLVLSADRCVLASH